MRRALGAAARQRTVYWRQAVSRVLMCWTLAAVFGATALTGCGEPPLHQQESYVFGTRVEVLIHGVDADRARPAAAAVLREFDRLHRAYHAWQPSELTALNAAIARGEKNIDVSDELALLLRDAAALAEKSDHLFNPAIGGLVALWGFHSDEFKPALPDERAVAALAAARPRLSDLTLVGTRVTSANREVAIDFGGYLKGYALDRAAAILKDQSIDNALVNIGGNIIALGDKGGQPWRVGIQHPRSSAPLATLELRDGEAIGTSGDYQRYFDVDGRRYCHLLDPRSGRPAAGTQAVTVLIPPQRGAGVLSDVASKPLFIAGPAQWRDYARRLGVGAALHVDAAGVIRITAAMRERIKMLDSGISPVIEP
jgi:thiamine biosynthesis lipoprotein